MRREYIKKEIRNGKDRFLSHGWTLIKDFIFSYLEYASPFFHLSFLLTNKLFFSMLS